MFSGLPTELIQRIFFQLDDLETLRAAALSCRKFFEAFAGIEELLTTDILLRQIYPTVLGHAIITQASSTLEGGHAAISKFSEDYLSTKIALPATWKLADALPLSRFHVIVDRFAARISCTALNRAPKSLKRPPQQPNPAVTEVHRVHRALYCYEIYCNMFRSQVPSKKDQRILFFSHFSTWENEQLSCVHDMLYCIIAEPFNDLVDHDIVWGAELVSYFTEFSNDDRGEFILAKGLNYLERIVNAQGYRERRDLLSFENWEDGPGRLADFLYNGLAAAGSPDWEDEWQEFCDLNEESQAKFVGRPFNDDLDPGPVAAWRWVYGQDLPGRLVGQSWNSNYRLWGYVFWDIARLRDSGILNHERVDIQVEHPLYEFGTSKRKLNLQESQEKRRTIINQGRSGWWSGEYQSQVIYENSKYKI